MKKRHIAFCVALLCAGTLPSCSSTTAPPQSNLIPLAIHDTIELASSDRALYVVNEGNFGKLNSSLDVVVFHSRLTTSDTTIYHGVLAGLGAGNDVAFNGDELLVLDNGSNLLDLGSENPLQSMSALPMGVDMPNKMAVIGTNRLLVTRRASNSAAIVDLSQSAIVDSIPLGEPSVAVAVLNNKAYITTGSYTGPWHLKIVDLVSHAVKKTIPLGGSPEQAVADSTSSNIIIGMIGDYATVSPQFYFVNATTDLIADSLTVGTPKDDAELTTGSKHFIIMGSDIYALNAPTHQLGASLVHASSPLYKGFYDGSTNQIFAGLYDFTSGAGKVEVYDATTGLLKWSFATGIGPAHFAFYH
ncbi:MAG: hypothetical protein Q8922_10940 [Bacteroidota bacterium]|nr:hypothetical protein [Bacteroidota bacterium]MDP4232638.1 hypothetical protein [Bacteroidota bacterium]MDP4243890.1 hypothetical protein [Bacteroidota bacterium]MDP4288441.1 hypothetical protein [Bacteroidota bacterium]